MAKDDDLLQQYRVDESRVEQAVNYEKQINQLQSRQEGLFSQKAEVEKELNGLAGNANDSLDNKNRYHEKAGEFIELESQIKENGQKLQETRQEYEQWKQEQPSIGQDANEQTIEKDYQNREGKPLNQNVGGYDQPDESKPLDDKSRQQADLLNEYRAENNSPHQEPQKEQQHQQENTPDEPER